MAERSSATERDRRERARRARAAQRATGGRAPAEPAPAPAAVGVRHEGALRWLVRSVPVLPARAVGAVAGVAREVQGILAAVGGAVVALVPGAARRGTAGRSARGVSTRPAAARPPAPAPRPSSEAERRELARRRVLRRRRLRAGAAAAGLLLLVIGWVVLPGAAVFRITHVEVLGAMATSDLEARRGVDELLTGETIFTVDADAVERRLEQLPFVREAHVETHLPGGIGLRISEYEPLAVGLADGATWLVARDGRILSKARRSDWTGRVPVVVLRGSRLEPGDRLDGEPALQVLAGIPADSPFIFSSIDLREGGVLVGHVRGSALEIRFGRPHGGVDLRTKLASAGAAMRDARRLELGELAYIDVSVPARPAACPVDTASCARPEPIVDEDAAGTGASTPGGDRAAGAATPGAGD